MKRFRVALEKTYSLKASALLLTLVLSKAQAQCVVDSVKADCGNTTLFFEQQRYDSISSFALVHVHENETTALQAAEWLLDSVKLGSLTTWRGQRQRLVDFSFGSKDFHFDPNRIYSPAGIASTLGLNASDTAITLVRAIADTFISHFILGKTLIIALHNNTNEGGLSVRSYGRGGIYSNEAKSVFINPRRDADDFFYTTEELLFETLKSKGFNIVLQNNKTVTDDGSLSVFCASRGIAYINVETETGHLQQQKNMLQVLWACLNNRLNPNKTDFGLKDN